jgi:hypothetical protein
MLLEKIFVTAVEADWARGGKDKEGKVQTASTGIRRTVRCGFPSTELQFDIPKCIGASS